MKVARFCCVAWSNTFNRRPRIENVFGVIEQAREDGAAGQQLAEDAAAQLPGGPLLRHACHDPPDGVLRDSVKLL